MGVAVAFEQPESDVMQRPPRPAGKRLFGKQALWRCFFVAGLLVAAILGQFVWHLSLGTSINEARAEAMTTLILGEVAYAANTRFLHSSSMAPRLFQGNKWFFFAVALTVALQVVLVHAPVVNTFFSHAPLDGAGWGRCIGLAVALFFVVEAEKATAQRFIMPFVAPCVRAMRRATPAALSTNAPPASVRLIVTSASTFGLPTGSQSPKLRPAQPA